MSSGSLMKTSYYPGVEAISPALPSEESQPDYSSTFRTSKDELLQNIDKIDREISQTETQISELKERKKQLELKAVSRDSVKDVRENVDNSSETRQLSIAQHIYSENRKKARESHATLYKLGPKFDLPLYNQPSDSPVYHKNIEKFKTFKPRLIKYFKRRHEERKAREKYLLETYDRLMSEWLKKLEKSECNPSKKAKDNKTREFFEKQFPELRKQREDRERLSRAGQRIRSDADLEEIMDGLQEQELEDRKMRSCAVIPPIIQDDKTRRYKFINSNGLVENPVEEYKELQLINVWLDHEKEIFREKFLQHPKNFGLIASYLERKTVPDCVHYYYLSKKRENYKQLLRKQVKKRTRALVKQQQQQQAQQQAQQASQQQSDAKGQADESSQAASGTEANSESSQNVVVQNDVDSNYSLTSKGESKDLSNSGNQPDNSSAVSLPLPGVTSSSGTKGLNDCNGKRDLSNKRHQGNADDISDNEENKCDGLVIKCCVCEDVIPPNSKCSSITKSNYHLYGINLDEIKGELKVCLNCRFKHVRKECPIQSCKTAKRKVKRLKLLPQQWFDLPNDLKQSIAKEMNIPPDIRKCCTRCVIRISRRIGAISPLLTYTRKSFTNEYHDWKDEEINKLKDGLSTKGKNWGEISTIVGSKDADQCKEFYFNYKYKLNLNQSIDSYWSKIGDSKPQASDSEDYWKDNSEDDSEATSSADEGVEKSNNDTINTSSPPTKISSGETVPTTTTTNTCNQYNAAVTTSQTIPVTSESVTITTKPRNSSSTSGDGSDLSSFPENKLGDLRAISTSQGSLKSDYDSSATVSADEGRGNGDDDMRSSPPSSKLPQRANSVMPAFPSSNHVILPSTDRAVRPASHDPAFTLEPALSHSSRPMEGLVAQQRYRAPPFLIHHDANSIRPPTSNPIPLLKIKTENVLGPPPASFPEEKPRFVSDIIHRVIETSFRSPMSSGKPLTLPLVPEANHSLTGSYNSSGPSGQGMPPQSGRESHPMLINNSPVPIYPPEIKKEIPSEPCKFGANIKPSTSNEIRVPRFNPHPYIKPEGLAMMASYPPTYPTSVVFQHPPSSDHDNEIQDLSKKTRKLEEPYSQSNLPPPKRERFDSPPNIRGNEFKNSPVPHDHMTPTPPPAHSNQLKRTPIPDLPVSNLSSSENVPMSNRPIESSRAEESGFMFSDRPGFSSMMVYGPSGSPLLRPAIRTPTNKPPLSSASPVIHTPPPPLIASSKSYPMSSGVQLSPQPSYRDKVIPPQMVSASGSITQGTPIIMAQHGQMHSNQYNQNRYEGLFRQLTPTYPKDSGSITLGTPVPQDNSKRKNELPMRHDGLGKPYGPGVYDTGPMDPYYRRMPGSNMPYQPQNQPQYHGSPINFPPNEGHMKPKFQVESQSSINQIMIDFNTSKQMQPRQNPSADVKEPHSISSLLMRSADSNPHMSPQGRVPSSMYPFAPPANIANIVAASGVPSQVIMGNNDPRYPNPSSVAPRLMHSNPSRSSPTPEHWISKAGPTPGYPIVTMAKRQNVIQQYNAPGCKQSVIQSVKSNSPRDVGMRQEPWPSPRFMSSSPGYSTSHDAFQTLVDAAVAQKSLAIPPTREDQQRMGIMNLARSVRQSKSPSNERQSNDSIEKTLHDMHQRSRPIQDMGNLRFGMDDRLRLLEADKRCLMPSNDPQQQPGRSSVNRSEEDKSMDNKYLPCSSESLSPQTSHRLPFTKESFEKELRHQDSRLQDSYGRKSAESAELQNNQSKNLSRAQLVELGDIEASRIFSQSFQKDENPRNHSKGEITAANIIDAIITHQINQSGEEGPGKESQQSPNSAENKTSEVRPAVSTSANENAVSYSMNEQNKQQEREENLSKSFDNRTSFDQNQQQPQQMPINQIEKDDPTSNQNFRDHIATIISKSFSNNSKVTPIAQPVTIIPCSQENNPSQVQPLLQIPVSSLIQTSNRTTVSISRPNSRPGDSTNTCVSSEATSHSENPHSDWKLRKALQQQTKIDNENAQTSLSSSSNNLTPTTTTAATTTNSSSSNIDENQSKETPRAESPYRSANWMSNYNFEPISPPSPAASDDNDDK
ncbi:nuclear receptor corepressor 1 [Tetranychus urticae]|uniref:SANT domain-containing protein n=1 Tax=Tetranychus urticae TaxID=32264 RepID=T1L2V3_TETUR|nr:nuclear receptor corepressor 1 [Tetranychus urticae]